MAARFGRPRNGGRERRGRGTGRRRGQSTQRPTRRTRSKLGLSYRLPARIAVRRAGLSGRPPGLSGWAGGPRIVMKTQQWGGPSACGLTPDPAVLAWRLVPLCDHIRNRATAAGHADRGGRRVSRALADHRRASHTSGGSVQRGRTAGRGVFRSLAGTGGRNRLAGDRNLFRHRLRPALLDRPARGSGVPVVRARSRPPVLRHGAARIRRAHDWRRITASAWPWRWRWPCTKSRRASRWGPSCAPRSRRAPPRCFGAYWWKPPRSWAVFSDWRSPRDWAPPGLPIRWRWPPDGCFTWARMPYMKSGNGAVRCPHS